MKSLKSVMMLKFCILGAFDRFMLIYSVYLLFFSRIGMTPIYIGYALGIYEIGKVISDPIFATLADKYGRKTLIIYGFLFKAIGVLMWTINPSIPYAFIGLFLIGIGKSGASNIEAYMYDEMKSINSDNDFRIAMAMKSVFTNISASCGGLFTSFLYKKYGFNGVFISSFLIITCISIPYIIFFLQDNKFYTNDNKKDSIIDICKNGLLMVKSNNKLLFATVITSLFYSVYIILADINKMIMNDINLTPDVVAEIYSIAHLIPAITTVLYIIIKPSISRNMTAILSIVMWVGISGISIAMYGKATIAAILMFIMFFPIFDSCVKTSFYKTITDSSKRSTISSFSHLLSSFINIVLSLGIGFLAHNFSYRLTIIVLCIFISIILFGTMCFERKKCGFIE